MASYDLGCAIHVHTTCSDGTATPEELIASARASGTECVIVCDHDTLGARPWAGWHAGVLVVVGMESSPKGGHLLCLGVDREVPHEGRSEREMAADVRAQGGLAIAAHPFSRGSQISRTIAPAHGWGAIDDPQLHGLEVWSLLTDTAEDCRTPFQLLRWLRRPEELAEAPRARALQAWDRLGRERRVVGIGGLDAHQKPGLRIGGRLRAVQRNERILRLLRTHVLLDAPPAGEDADADRVLEALREGRCYLGLDHVADPGGTRFEAAAGDATVPMGAEAPADGAPWTLRFSVPREGRLRLLRDGAELAAVRGRHLEAPAAGPGVYRAEAWVAHGGRERSWVLTNPVYLR